MGGQFPAESMSLALDGKHLLMQRQDSALTGGGPRDRAEMPLTMADDLQLGSLHYLLVVISPASAAMCYCKRQS
jgi:hypothetical protein